MAQTYFAQTDAAGVISIRRAAHDGLMTIATGSRHRLTTLVHVASRHGYELGVYLVPGIPEAANRADAMDALLDFVDWLAQGKRDGLVFPMAGMDKTGRSTSIERFQRTAEMLAGEG